MVQLSQSLLLEKLVTLYGTSFVPFLSVALKDKESTQMKYTARGQQGYCSTSTCLRVRIDIWYIIGGMAWKARGCKHMGTTFVTAF